MHKSAPGLIVAAVRFRLEICVQCVASQRRNGAVAVG